MIELAEKLSKEYIQNLLLRQDDVGMHSCGKALLRIMARQTATERTSKEVLRNNGRGFTPSDAYLGTDMANFYAQRGFLSQKQLAYWRKPNAAGVPRICKYWKQLQEEAMKRYNLQELPKRVKGSVPEQLNLADSKE